MSGKKKKCRPISKYPVPAIRCTGTYYAIPIPLSSRSFPIYLNRYNKYIFEKTVPTISGCYLSYTGTDTNFRCVTRKGKWLFHLRPDTNLYVLPSSSKIPLPLKVGEYPVCVSGLRLRLGYCKCMRYQSLVPSHWHPSIPENSVVLFLQCPSRRGYFTWEGYNGFVVSRKAPWQLLFGQFHTLGSFPVTTS
jgi:hypothetical protein